MNIKNDTVLFLNDNVTITAANIKLDMDIYFDSFGVLVDISKFYNVKRMVGNKYNKFKLIRIGAITFKRDKNNKIYSVSPVNVIKFIDTDCEVSLPNYYDSTKYVLFCNDYKMNYVHYGIYKHNICLANNDKITRHRYIGRKCESDKPVDITPTISVIKDMLAETFNGLRFNNDKFIYKVFSGESIQKKNGI